MKTLFSALCHHPCVFRLELILWVRIWIWHTTRLMGEEMTQRLQQIHVQSSFALLGNPHRLRFESATGQYCRQLAITHDHSYRYVLLKTTTPSVPDCRISRRAFSGLPELGWSRYAAQQTWWKLTHRLEWNRNTPYLVESRGKSFFRHHSVKVKPSPSALGTTLGSSPSTQ